MTGGARLVGEHSATGGAAKRIGIHPPATALSAKAGDTLSGRKNGTTNPDRNELLGVSCNRSLGGDRSAYAGSAATCRIKQR
jgi:hypothetical protein